MHLSQKQYCIDMIDSIFQEREQEIEVLLKVVSLIIYI